MTVMVIMVLTSGDENNGNDDSCNKTNVSDKINHVGDSGDETKDFDNSFKGDTSNNVRNVKRSIYADLLCPDCQYKIQKERCGKCKSLYNCAKTSKYEKKKKSIENDLNQSDPIISEESDSNHTYLEQSITKKTVANLTSRTRVEILRSPRKQALVGVNLIKNLPDPIKKKAIKEINSAYEEDQIDRILTNITKNLKGEVGSKNTISYQIINGITSSYSEIFQKKYITNIRKILKINWENAGKIKSRTKLARKKYEGKITAKVIEKIQGFYLNDSISRVSTSKKNISKRTGTVRRYMKFSIKDVFIMFRNVEPEIKVSFSKFYMLKPKNFKTAGKTPMESSLCPYCLNV